MQAAQEHVRAGKFPAAVKAATAGLALDSTSADLNNLLATAEASQGRYRPAIDALERALRHHPDFALGHLNLGGLYTKLGRFDLVEVSLERALELRPDWSSVHRRLAELYLGSGRPEAAVDAIRKAIELFPGDATLTFYLGRSLETAGREEAAMAAFRQAADLDIGFEEALYRLSVLARRSGRRALADSALERFEHLQRIGNDPEVHKKMKKLRSSILNAPEDGAHHYALGAFFSRWGYWDEALDKFARAAALAPGDPHRRNQIGSLLVQNSRPGEAILLLRGRHCRGLDIRAGIRKSRDRSRPSRPRQGSHGLLPEGAAVAASRSKRPSLLRPESAQGGTDRRGIGEAGIGQSPHRGRFQAAGSIRPPPVRSGGSTRRDNTVAPAQGAGSTSRTVPSIGGPLITCSTPLGQRTRKGPGSVRDPSPK